MGNEYLKSAILNVVENQIKSNNPPETKATYNRLLSLGYSSDESKNMLALVVSAEIFDILKKQEEFNKDRFVEALNKLPDAPD